MELFKIFFPLIEIDLRSYDFFQAHYFIHNAVYTLEPRLNQSGFYLSIVLDKIIVTPFPESGFCQHFIEEMMIFCPVKTNDLFCRKHKDENDLNRNSGTVFSDPLKNYYLNLQYLESITEEDFLFFSESGLFLVDHIIQIKKALDLFSLPPSADHKRIKERYRYLVKKKHPDANPDSFDFEEIQEAYEILISWKKDIS